MKSHFTLFAFLVLSLAFVKPSDFLSDQKRFPRVRKAIEEKQQIVESNLSKNDLNIKDFQLILTVFKEEGELNLYGKKKGESEYKKIATYDICAPSGVLGPKRKQGDYQVPEGFYSINRFNPSSAFYLSLGINYPNISDRRKSKFSNLGGDIFIHGSCVTIGCLPMTDPRIKEIYLYAVNARNNGQEKIPVYIFPFKMTEEKMKLHNKMNAENTSKMAFWNNLKSGYDKFTSEHKELEITTAKNGDYQF